MKHKWQQQFILLQTLNLILWVVLILLGFLFLLFFKGFWVGFGLNLILGSYVLHIKLKEYLGHSVIFQKQLLDEVSNNSNLIFWEVVLPEDNYQQQQYKDWFVELDFALQQSTNSDFYKTLNSKNPNHTINIDIILHKHKLVNILSGDQNLRHIIEHITAKHFPLIRLIPTNNPTCSLVLDESKECLAGSAIGHSQWTVMLYLPLPWTNDNQSPVNNFFGYLDFVLLPSEKAIMQYNFEFGIKQKGYQNQFFKQREQEVYDQLQVQDPDSKYKIFLEKLYPIVDNIHKNAYAKRLMVNNILVATSIKIIIIGSPDRYEELEKCLEKAIYNYFWDANMEKVYIASTNQVAFNEPRKSINPDIAFIYDRIIKIPDLVLLLFRKWINCIYYYNENRYWRHKLLNSTINRNSKTTWQNSFSLLDRDSISGVFQFPKLK